MNSPTSNSLTPNPLFFRQALDEILRAKESKKVAELQESAQIALSALLMENEEQLDFDSVFKPLLLSCQSKQAPLIVLALDCMGKIFQYNFFQSMYKNASKESCLPIQDKSLEDHQTPLPTLSESESSPRDVQDVVDVEEEQGDSSQEHIPETPTTPHTNTNSNQYQILTILIDTICSCCSSGDHTDARVQLQIAKTLSSCVLAAHPDPLLHSTSLLKVIRTTYTLFLLSKNTNVQLLAQSTVSQMVNTVFSRVVQSNDLTNEEEILSSVLSLTPSTSQVHSNHHSNPTFTNGNEYSPTIVKPNRRDSMTDLSLGESSTLKDAKSADELHQENTASKEFMISTGPSLVRSSTDILTNTHYSEREELNVKRVHERVKDAYLVFRALCKLSMKPIPNPDGPNDLKSQAMRSKLLALHLIHQLLLSFNQVFVLPAPVLFASHAPKHSNAVKFIHAVKQYLCLSLSRNMVSVVPQVFDIAMDIFSRLLIQLRSLLKKELGIIFIEIMIPILEAKNSITFHQRYSLVKSLYKLLSDPKSDGGRLLVEMYLNYDCDEQASAKENIWERTVNALCKIMTQHVSFDKMDKSKSSTPSTPLASHTVSSSESPAENSLPEITSANMTLYKDSNSFSLTGDYVELKKKTLETLVKGVLAPLIQWTSQRTTPFTSTIPTSDILSDKANDQDVLEETERTRNSSTLSEDDPSAFESIKQRKQQLKEGIQKFNLNYKKGIHYLLQSGCIPSIKPLGIAIFLASTPGLNKAKLGEYLGEGELENIEIMHSFVDQMNFKGLKFVEALRFFLQSFRLPGEAQKIDRFMLKFADRFLKDNPEAFSSADTAYVLAYSVIMLNTDLHNQQVKRKMTREEFIKNNRGIDNGQDIPSLLLQEIYTEILGNEIVMNEERRIERKELEESSSQILKQNGIDSVQVFAQTSENMALKTEAAILNNPKKYKSLYNFYVASHYEHVKPMFELVWLGTLAGLSWPLQESNDMETIELALEGFKHAVRISCLFELTLETNAFVSTISKATQLNNLNEMRGYKNLACVKTLLEIACLEGNYLRENWSDVVKVVSLLEKLQITGNNGNQMMERVSGSLDSSQTSNSYNKKEAKAPKSNPKPNPILEQVAAQVNSQTMTITVDRLFTSSKNLSGSAIVEFVKCLCMTSWEEITSSSDKEHPRMYCLQRLVEIGFYNMNRIRLEWVNIWNILGEHFNQVGCHVNANVSFFALDKLRQLSFNFMDLEELSNFKFQKEFLKPFEETLVNNPDPKIKDMVLACLQQLLQAKGHKLKSGWKTMFATLIKAAKEQYEPIVILSFESIKYIYKNNFQQVVLNSSFPDFIACLVEFCKNQKFTKQSLQSIELLRASISKVNELIKSVKFVPPPLNTKVSENLTEMMSLGFMSVQSMHVGSALPLTQGHTLGATLNQSHTQNQGILTQGKEEEEANLRFWFPILFGLYEIIMICDLEVRSRALVYLFDTLKSHGSEFSQDFWGMVAKGVLFPIFDDLRLSRQEHTKFANKDDMSVWMSTTLIQALRLLIDLFSFYFEELRFLYADLLSILEICMTQENETLSRIGSTCLQELIQGNLCKLHDQEFDLLCGCMGKLLSVTTPHALFFDLSLTESESIFVSDNPSEKVSYSQNVSDTPSNKEMNKEMKQLRGPQPKPSEFQKIIVKCVLHLLILQTIQEMLMSSNSSSDSSSDSMVVKRIPTQYLLSLADTIYKSFKFAEEFNADLKLRNALLNIGFMKQLPNLLKQETSSMSLYIWILSQLYSDVNQLDRQEYKSPIEERFILKSKQLITDYNQLDPETKKRNIIAWNPVILNILKGIEAFAENDFKRHIYSFYPALIDLLLHDITPEFRLALHGILVKLGKFNKFN